MKIIIKILVPVIIAITPFAIYISNPFNIPTENIRPRVIGHDIYRIPSKSMLPTLVPDDYIIISNTAYLNESPKSGDIIVFNRVSKKSLNITVPFIKRVIATAGDKIEIQKGIVYINNEPLKEDYIKPENMLRPYSQFHPVKIVPSKMVFVLGDNRDKSSDSRIFGFVPLADIIGKAKTIAIGKDGRFWKQLK